MNTKPAALSFLFTLLALCGSTLGTLQKAHAGKGSLECGSVVVSSITLNNDIGPCSGDGLKVVSSGITIDLNGYKIYASRRQNVGVKLENVSNVVVKGGTISGFDSGVLIEGGWNNRVTNATARNNRFGIRIEDAISGTHKIDNSLFAENRIFGVWSSNVSELVISRNRVQGNRNGGIVFGGNTTLSSIRENVAKGNIGSDIELQDDEPWVAYQNAIPPLFGLTASGRQAYIEEIDYHIGGHIPTLIDITARVVPVGIVLDPGATVADNPIPADTSTSGCSASDYATAGLVRGDIALVQRGTCLLSEKVDSALSAGASAVIIFNEGQAPDRLTHAFGFVASFSANGSGLIPQTVVFASYRVGLELLRSFNENQSTVRLRAQNTYSSTPGPGYAHDNLITKNTADHATDQNGLCASYTNRWTKNQFLTWNQNCVVGDLSGGGFGGGTGSRARLY